MSEAPETDTLEVRASLLHQGGPAWRWELYEETLQGNNVLLLSKNEFFDYPNGAADVCKVAASFNENQVAKRVIDYYRKTDTLEQLPANSFLVHQIEDGWFAILTLTGPAAFDAVTPMMTSKDQLLGLIKKIDSGYLVLISVSEEGY